ncbi:MAG: aldo/keto reductase [Peptostreptococcaceae bacterium]
MEFRKLGRTSLEVSTIGFGGEYLNNKSKDYVANMIDKAIENKINIIDIFMPQPETRENIGLAMEGKRDKFVIQGHICTHMVNNQYERTRDFEKSKKSFENLFKALKTDYIDIGMIHYVDDEKDFDTVFNGPIIKYLIDLKKEGKIGFIGMSSHNTKISQMAVNTGLVDVLMFSINPAYDLEDNELDIYDLMEFKGLEHDSWQIDPERKKLYLSCEEKGVGITVMKTLGAGRLLDGEDSPFKKELTPIQCIHYSLTRAGVCSVLLGFGDPTHIDEDIKYYSATDEEKDYAKTISKCSKIDIKGKCMYCNHCLPCPMGIDVAMVTKYLDIASFSEEIPETIKNHYNSLKAKGGDCISCGSCEKNCPFSVNIIDNMKKAKEVFGK